MKSDSKNSEGIDQQLDLLVDDELPETDRVTVLRSLDATNRWRDLAIRFLQRQVERSAIRQIMQQRNIAPPGNDRTIPFSQKSMYQLRVAAAFILMVGLTAGTIYYFNRTQTASTGTGNSAAPQVADMMSFVVPTAPLTESTGAAQPSHTNIAIPVSVLPNDPLPDLQTLVHDTPTHGAASHHVVIMPNGNNSAVVFPVSTVKEIIY